MKRLLAALLLFCAVTAFAQSTPNGIPVWTQTAINNTLASDQQEIALLNNNAQQIFNQAWASYAANVAAGNANAVPPPVPMAYGLGPTDANGFPTLVQTTTPLFAMPPLPTAPTPVSMPTNAGFIPAIGQSIDPPAGAPSYPLGTTIAEPTPTGTVYFLVNQANSPFFPGLVKTIWTRVAPPASA